MNSWGEGTLGPRKEHMGGERGEPDQCQAATAG